MAKIIVVTSGKGGVGKTTTSASFASALAMRGHKTAVIDFDVGLRNLDLIMGCERRVVYDFVNVIHGEAVVDHAALAAHDQVQVAQADVEVDDGGLVAPHGQGAGEAGAGGGL